MTNFSPESLSKPLPSHSEATNRSRVSSPRAAKTGTELLSAPPFSGPPSDNR